MSTDPWAEMAMTLDEATDAIGRTAKASIPSHPAPKALGRWGRWRVRRLVRRGRTVKAQRIILRSVVR